MITAEQRAAWIQLAQDHSELANAIVELLKERGDIVSTLGLAHRRIAELEAQFAQWDNKKIQRIAALRARIMRDNLYDPAILADDLAAQEQDQ